MHLADGGVGALEVVAGPHHNGHQVKAVAAGAHGQAAAGLGRVAGLAGGDGAVQVPIALGVKEKVGVGKRARRVSRGRGQVPGGAARDAHKVVVLHGGGQDLGHVGCAGVVVVVVQAAGVHKVRVDAAQLGGLLVHHVGKGLVVAGHVAGQDIGGLVARGQQQAGEKILDGQGLPRHQARGRAVGGDLIEVGLRDRLGLVKVCVVKDHQGAHDLGHRGRVAALGGVLVVDDGVGGAVDDHGGAGSELGAGDLGAGLGGGGVVDVGQSLHGHATQRGCEGHGHGDATGYQAFIERQERQGLLPSCFA